MLTTNHSKNRWMFQKWSTQNLPKRKQDEKRSQNQSFHKSITWRNGVSLRRNQRYHEKLGISFTIDHFEVQMSFVFWNRLICFRKKNQMRNLKKKETRNLMKRKTFTWSKDRHPSISKRGSKKKGRRKRSKSASSKYASTL